MQLDLFDTMEVETTTFRKPNRTEFEIINTVFGPQYMEAISSVLMDVVDLYPYKSFFRAYDPEPFLLIGASVTLNNYFYVLDEAGCVWRYHQFCMFPSSKTF